MERAFGDYPSTSKSTRNPLSPRLARGFSLFWHIKKPSPVGEGGSRRLTDEESVSFFSNTSSTANAVPLPPLGKAMQFYR